MCSCILIWILNNQHFIWSRRSAFTLPCRIRTDFHWALTQDLSVPGYLILSAEMLVIWTGSPFRREATSLGQVRAGTGRPEHLPWLCRDDGCRAGLRGRRWLEVPFPVHFWEGLEWSTEPCKRLSASSLFPLLFPLLPVDLHTGAALPRLLEGGLDSPLLAKAPLFLAGCWKLEGLDSNASGCWTETDGETVRSLEWCQTKAFECGVSGKKDADGLHINLTFFQLTLN